MRTAVRIGASTCLSLAFANRCIGVSRVQVLPVDSRPAAGAAIDQSPDDVSGGGSPRADDNFGRSVRNQVD